MKSKITFRIFSDYSCTPINTSFLIFYRIVVWSFWLFYLIWFFSQQNFFFFVLKYGLVILVDGSRGFGDWFTKKRRSEIKNHFLNLVYLLLKKLKYLLIKNFSFQNMKNVKMVDTEKRLQNIKVTVLVTKCFWNICHYLLRSTRT